MWPEMHHHHLGLALIEKRIERVWIALQDDLSWLETGVKLARSADARYLPGWSGAGS